MARDPQQIRKAYEHKLGKDLTAKLTDENIHKLSTYYNSLPPDQQSQIDSEIMMGKGDFLASAREFAKVNKKQKAATPPPPKPTQDTETPEKRQKRIKDVVATATRNNQKNQQKQQTNYQKDPKVEKLLGIGGIDDLTEEEYLTLLREKVMAGQMVNSQISSEETQAYREEFQRVRQKKPVTSSSSKPKKVSAQKLLNASGRSIQQQKRARVIPALKKTRAVAQGGGVQAQVVEGNDSSNIIGKVVQGLAVVSKSLTGVSSLLGALLREEKVQTAQKRNIARDSRRAVKESSVEKGAMGSAMGMMKNIKAPKVPFFERITQFFGNIMAGAAVLWVVEWISNPDNQESLDNIVNFFSEHMGLILGGILALIGLNIGIALIGFVVALKAAVVALSAALVPLLIVIGTIAGAAAIAKGAEELSKWSERQRMGGVRTDPGLPGETRGMEYDPAHFERSEHNIRALLDATNPDTNVFGIPEDMKKYSEGPFRELLEQELEDLEKLNERLRLRKSTNDDLARWNKKIDFIQDQITTLQEEGESGEHFNPREGTVAGQIARLQKQLAEVQNNQEYLDHKTNWEQQSKMISALMKNIDFRSLMADDRVKQLIPRQLRQQYQDWRERQRLHNQQNPQAQGQTPVIPQTAPPPAQQSGTPQVVIPLDHARTPRAVPDTTGGSTYDAAAATGADGRERQHQDPAARKLQAELAARGVNAQIVRPEDFASYAEYDAYLKEMDAKGVRSIPLHFDAIRNAGGVGFLTRTRAGDTGDAALAAPINEVLRDFQRNNPELGNYSTDTKGNKTVNIGRNSPTALVELGVLKDWEDHHGPNFTNSDKFQELIRGVADGIVEGGNFKLRPAAEQNRTESPVPPNQEVSFMPLPGWNGSGGGQSSSSASGGQKVPPAFSPMDPNNLSTFATKSIYNTVTVT